MKKTSGEAFWQLRRRPARSRVLWNCAVMAVIIVPLFEVAVWILGAFRSGPSLEDIGASAVFSWALLIVPALGYTLIQQLVATLVLRWVPVDRHRAVAIVTAVALIPTVVAFRVAPGFLLSWSTGGAALFVATVFGAVQALPMKAGGE